MGHQTQKDNTMTIRKTTAAIIAALTLVTLAACGTQAERASHNVSVEADNFNVDRRLAVINTITGDPQLELIGKFSIKDADNQLEVTVKDDNGNFKKHIVGLGPTVTYVVEDISGADISNTRYQISYLPDAIIPITVENGMN